MTRAATAAKDVTLLELLDRIIDRGVVLVGDLTISVADVDLIFLGLKVMLTSVERAEKMRWGLDLAQSSGEING
ncbi:MAG: gas vesicle protein [Chloroflexi bacterium]|nr:gas vesicle protein [Chloroflexota bacterium]